MRFFPLRISSNINIDFFGFRKIAYTMSCLAIACSIFAIFFIKPNFGIDFLGGVEVQIRSKKLINTSEVRSKLHLLNLKDVTIQKFSDHDVSIRFTPQSTSNADSKDTENYGIPPDASAEVQKLKNELVLGGAGNILEYRRIDVVGPQIGSYIINSGIKAIILAFATIMIYIWIRFEWQFGIGVLVTLLHDAIISVGFMSLTGLEFNASSIAGILTIIGYSVNDSVVIYDRIRENMKFNKDMPRVVNKSINQTLSRTLFTVLTTLIANLALIIFGGTSIKSFSILVFFGILIGTYSSIFIASPIVTLFKRAK
jgi:preprotein translocase subunit SecF